MLPLGGVLRDAARLWRQDAALLVAIGGLFLFVPLLALELLLPPAPLPTGAGGGMMTPDFSANSPSAVWLLHVAPWCALAAIPIRYGMLALLALYLDPRWPTVRDALVNALFRLPAFILLVVLLWLPISVGGFLLLVPGLYIAARLSLVGATLTGTRGGIVEAVRGSIARSRGSGLQLLALFACLIPTIILGWLPFGVSLALLELAIGPGPILAGLTAVAIATVMAATLLTATLLQVTAYRRLAPISGT